MIVYAAGTVLVHLKFDREYDAVPDEVILVTEDITQEMIDDLLRYYRPGATIGDWKYICFSRGWFKQVSFIQI